MRFSKQHMVMASVLLASTFGWGQKSQNNGRETSLLVRMSFTSPLAADFGERNFPQICFSVDLAGHYQLRRLTTVQLVPRKDNREFLQETPKTELLQGTLLPGELAKLEKLLENREFRELTSTPRFLLNDGETFVAEVPRENGVQRVVMSNADNQNPFPRSAERIVNWLQHFKAEGAEPLDVSATDICPSGVLQPVNPGLALLQPVPRSGACLMR